MSRQSRPAFRFDDLAGLRGEARSRLVFDWWCDEDDRPAFIAALAGKPFAVDSRAPLQIDPAPPLDEPAPMGFRQVWLLSHAEDIHEALTRSDRFGNQPYAALGGASFLLAMDPGPGYGGVDWHEVQQQFIRSLLNHYAVTQLHALARTAAAQAALTSLAQPVFDLAHFAEQAALRHVGQLFGFGFQDHPLLEAASRATYRALQYLAIGQHFVSEPGTLPAAQQALARLVARTAELADEYSRLRRSPRATGTNRQWPWGTQPPAELGLSALGEPVLQRLSAIDSPLSGRDRAMVVATLIAGTLGNVQSAVCLLVQSLMQGDPAERDRLRRGSDRSLSGNLLERLKDHLPIPLMPRRTRTEVTLSDGTRLPAGTDCLVLMGGLRPRCPAHAWGDPDATRGRGVHHCLGDEFAMPLITATVRHTLALKGLRSRLDPLTGEVMTVTRLWGFACASYPLQFDRERERVQRNLIVAMPVKAPISENAMRLRQLVAAAAPRIEQVLVQFGHVHFAWFEFTEGDRHLVLRTIFDGQLEAYLHHFATHAGDLFDGLFEFLEGAPPRPVSEHPHEFIEAVRLHDRPPLGGYLYSAYPLTEASQVSPPGEQP